MEALKRAADRSGPTYFPDIEKEADEFRGELLIPEKILRDNFSEIFNQRGDSLPFQKIQCKAGSLGFFCSSDFDPIRAPFTPLR
ncbi:MAG: hypothetical protein WCF19_03000 [Chlamydiales bacterium]